jgi:hypothetical protein
MLLSVPAGFFSALVNVGAKTVMLERSPEDTRGQILATQSTLSNAIALVPTIGAGLAIDLIDVRPVALTIAILLVLGAIAGRRIGAGGQSVAETLAPPMTPPPATSLGRRK